MIFVRPNELEAFAFMDRGEGIDIIRLERIDRNIIILLLLATVASTVAVTMGLHPFRKFSRFLLANIYLRPSGLFSINSKQSKDQKIKDMIEDLAIPTTIQIGIPQKTLDSLQSLKTLSIHWRTEVERHRQGRAI